MASSIKGNMVGYQHGRYVLPMCETRCLTRWVLDSHSALNPIDRKGGYVLAGDSTAKHFCAPLVSTLPNCRFRLYCRRVLLAWSRRRNQPVDIPGFHKRMPGSDWLPWNRRRSRLLLQSNECVGMVYHGFGRGRSDNPARSTVRHFFLPK
jgi:hypothetical protein